VGGGVEEDGKQKTEYRIQKSIMDEQSADS